MQRFSVFIVRASRLAMITMNLSFAILIFCSLLPAETQHRLNWVFGITAAGLSLFYVTVRSLMVTAFKASIWTASGSLARFISWAIVPAAATVVSVIDTKLITPSVCVAALVLVINLFDWFTDHKSRRSPDYI